MRIVFNNQNKIQRIGLFVGVFILLICSIGKVNALSKEQEIAFPTAQGFGKYATGGGNGQLYIVTSLADDAEKPTQGTLRYAIEQKHPRTIVFAVSGIIKLVDELKISHGNITIAGQTSPGGVTLIGAPVTVSSSENVIIRYMRFRLGTFGYAEDSLTVRNSNTIMIDHCSLSWSVDETASFYNNRNFTLQNSIISYSLNDSIHPKGKHGYGGIWGGANASFINNIIANHASRTPRINGHRLKSPYPQQQEFVELVNNIIFNWGHNNVYGSENGRFNLINNYYKPGKATKRIQFADIWYSPQIKENHAYIFGNVIEGDVQLSAKNWLGVNYRQAEKAKRTVSKQNSIWLSDKPIITSTMQPALHYLTAEKSYLNATQLQSIGATRNANGKFIDNVDALVYQQLTDSVPIKGDGLIDHEFDLIGSWPAYAKQFAGFASIVDSNQDGIDDNWLKDAKQKRISFAPEQALSEYLNYLAAD
ncbi:MAG: pectate lyase family protein [Pseudoalteromonas sp.]